MTAYFGNIFIPLDFSWRFGVVERLAVRCALRQSHQVRGICSSGEFVASSTSKPLSGCSFDVQRRGRITVSVNPSCSEMVDRRRLDHFQLRIRHRNASGRHHPRQGFGRWRSRLGPCCLLGQSHRRMDFVGCCQCVPGGCRHVTVMPSNWLVTYNSQCLRFETT